MTAYDAIIIGAGAAGLYCAMHSAKRGRNVLILEHNDEPGAKILISGGGRCNFTNINANDPARFVSANTHFARQLFCDGVRSSTRIIAMLLDECAAGGVTVKLQCQIVNVRKSDRFVVETSRGDFESASVVVAAGGLSIPKMGATGIAYDIAKHFKLPVEPTRPGLVPLTFSDNDLAWMRPLSGVSADVVVRAGTKGFREAAPSADASQTHNFVLGYIELGRTPHFSRTY